MIGAESSDEFKQQAYDAGRVPGEAPDKVDGDKPEQEQELFKSCWNGFQRAQIGGNQAHEKYEEYLERWRMKRDIAGRQDWQASIRTGVDFAILETEVSMVLSTIPNPEFKSGSDPALRAVAAVRGALVRDWEKRTIAMADYEKHFRKSLINGCSYLKVYWDPFACGGLGDVARRVLDPRNVYIAPDEGTPHGMPEMWVVEWFYPEQLEAFYGERAFGLRAQQANYGSGVPSDASTSDIRMIPVVYRYWPCYEFTEQRLPIEAPAGEPMPTDDTGDLSESEIGGKPLTGILIPVMKYPSGRITVFHESGRILDDRPNPYPWWNIVPLVNYADPEMATGVSEYDLIAQMQDRIDRFVADVCEHESRFAGPGVKLPTNSGIEPDQITLRPGEVYPLNPGTAQDFDFLQPPPIQDYVIRFPELLMQMIQRATGVSEIAQGVRPAGLETFASIRAFQESTLGRLKPKSQAFDRCYVRILELVDFLMTSRYITPRKLRISGDDGMRLAQMVQTPEFQQAAQQNSGFGQPGAEMPWGPEEAMKYLGNADKDYYFSVVGLGLKGACQIEAERGNLVAMTQSDVAAMSKDLFQAGAIDQQALLEAVQMPNTEQILERAGQMQQAQQQIQQLQQQIQQMGKELQAAQKKLASGGMMGGGMGGPVAPGPGQEINQAPPPQQGQVEDHGPLDADIENALLAEGRMLATHPQDAPDHYQRHMKAYQQAPKEVRPAFEDHLRRTQAQMQQGQQAQAPGGQPR